MRDGCSILVRNLRHETSPQKVRRAFEKWGVVRDVYLPLDYYNKKPRGFGFVEFAEEEGAHSAIANMHNTDIDGNLISVIVAQDRRKSPESMRRLQSDQRRQRNVPRRGDSFSGQYSRYRSRSRSPSYGRGKSDGRRRYGVGTRRNRSPSDSRDRDASRDRDCSRERDGSPDRQYMDSPRGRRDRFRSPRRSRGDSPDYRRGPSPGRDREKQYSKRSRSTDRTYADSG